MRTITLSLARIREIAIAILKLVTIVAFISLFPIVAIASTFLGEVLLSSLHPRPSLRS